MAYPMGSTETTEDQRKLLLEVKKNLEASLKVLMDREIEDSVRYHLLQAITELNISLTMIASERGVPGPATLDEST